MAKPNLERILDLSDASSGWDNANWSAKWNQGWGNYKNPGHKMAQPAPAVKPNYASTAPGYEPVSA